MFGYAGLSPAFESCWKAERLSRPVLGLPSFQEPRRISLLGMLNRPIPSFSTSSSPAARNWEPTAPVWKCWQVCSLPGRESSVHRPGADPGATGRRQILPCLLIRNCRRAEVPPHRCSRRRGCPGQEHLEMLLPHYPLVNQ